MSMTGTSAQLKDKIDSGRTGDKVPFPDHAAAPLGTDEEAGGNSPTVEEIHAAITIESKHPRPAESLSGMAIMLLSVVLIFLCILGSWIWLIPHPSTGQ
jgi:hypothetical protein